VRPAHTPFDGDSIFALASGAVALEKAAAPDKTALRAAQIGRIGSAAADCLARAIARAVHASVS
jgi:L-aminopeptidase/D-esterase-like protein